MSAIRTAAVLLLTLVAAQSNAAIETDNNGLNIVRVTDFEFMGMLFDVTFSDPNSSYNSFYGNDSPYFLGDSAGANAFRSALISEWNSLSPVPTTAGGSNPIRLPTSASADEIFGLSARHSTGSWGPGVFSMGSSVADVRDLVPIRGSVWAQVTKTGTITPEAASSLTWLGLLGMAAMKRRRAC